MYNTNFFGVNKKELINTVNTLPIWFVSGKDCSEYAEDVIHMLGMGELLTYEEPNPISFFGQPEQKFLYHTVVAIDSYIVDVTNEQKVFDREEYNLMMGNGGHKGYSVKGW